MTLEANELIWMTDTTPHESLPLEPGTYRQYFRLVTSDVSVWYAKHSTPNPKGIKPGSGVRVIYEDKFNAGGGRGRGAGSGSVVDVSDGHLDVFALRRDGAGSTSSRGSSTSGAVG